ncbi:MAG TPA: N-(5'-phosphoribosyl)anthranilate isomerase [Prolixibacteraceae bacterium]|nr:N-(5'-phosphoribosyl)anthranilate isomerase [Prolixibacteraceae bacterium]HCU61261.1 N-(5'-phosphoribosyl)anthranilate isomerase [Prolixibacteraceae bacterium]
MQKHVSEIFFPLEGKVRKGALKIKVCGMRDPENIAGIASGGPDFMGFIFYPKSKRFTGFDAQTEILNAFPEKIQKVGVFVNETPEQIFATSRVWKLDAIQLHGQETPDNCRQIQYSVLPVFKAFSIDESFDFEILKAYQDYCDYFLFDTKGQFPGGTGQKFNWALLEDYQLDVPFFLSGGIGPDDVESIRNFRHPQLFGIDINSGFEISPGLKDIEKVRKFISEIKSDIV